MKKEKTETAELTEKQKNNGGSKGMRTVRTVFNVIVNILIVAILVTSLLVAALALTSKADPDNLPNIFGFTFQYVQTNSMDCEPPEGFEGGNFSDQDVIICKIYTPGEFPELKVGDIITYRSNMTDDDGNRLLITHRIVEEKEINGEKAFRTKGDNGDTIDQLDVGNYLTVDSIVSVFYTDKFHGKILKGFANFFRTIRSQKGFFGIILIPMIIFFLYAIVRVVINAMSYKKEKNAEEKQNAVDAAVAEALAEKEKKDAELRPENMTPEQLEQFKQFLAQQNAEEASPAEEE